MGLTKTDFALRKDLQDILLQDLRVDTRAETELGDRYLISSVDSGAGSLMVNGLYANPLSVGGITTLNSSQQISKIGEYYINGNYSITLPPLTGFEVGDQIVITPRLGSTTAEVVGDSATDILTKLGTTDKIVFDKNIPATFTHNGTNWEI